MSFNQKLQSSSSTRSFIVLQPKAPTFFFCQKLHHSSQPKSFNLHCQKTQSSTSSNLHKFWAIRNATKSKQWRRRKRNRHKLKMQKRKRLKQTKNLQGKWKQNHRSWKKTSQLEHFTLAGNWPSPFSHHRRGSIGEGYDSPSSPQSTTPCIRRNVEFHPRCGVRMQSVFFIVHRNKASRGEEQRSKKFVVGAIVS